jgi:hypothetical protein
MFQSTAQDSASPLHRKKPLDRDTVYWPTGHSRTNRVAIRATRLWPKRDANNSMEVLGRRGKRGKNWGTGIL